MEKARGREGRDYSHYQAGEARASKGATPNTLSPTLHCLASSSAPPPLLTLLRQAELSGQVAAHHAVAALPHCGAAHENLQQQQQQSVRALQ